MPIWRLFYSGIYTLGRTLSATVIDALFPLSPAEEELASILPQDVLNILPPAPPYDFTVVPLPACRSIFAYKDERVSRMIWCVKYKRSAHALRLGGYALFQALSQEFGHKPGSAPGCLLIPIPITAKRRRERGYNQCELLIDEVVRLDVGHRFIALKDLLIRTQNSIAQKTKDRQARLEGARGLFEVSKNKQIKSQSGQIRVDADMSVPIVVIDDVVTTGSTMKEAIDVLKAAGFSDVRGLSLAH